MDGGLRMSVPDIWADRVTCAALVMSLACFAASAVETVIRLIRTSNSSSGAATAIRNVGIESRGMSAENASKLLEAAAKLVDSFIKATPGVVTAEAALVLLSIAAYVAKPPAPTTEATTQGNIIKT